MKTFKVYFAIALWVQVLILHLAIFYKWHTVTKTLWLLALLIDDFFVMGKFSDFYLMKLLSIPPLLFSAFVGLIASLIKDFRKPLP